jgi:hypothetical protein
MRKTPLQGERRVIPETAFWVGEDAGARESRTARQSGDACGSAIDWAVLEKFPPYQYTSVRNCVNAGSRVTSLKPSNAACAASIRSNGSRCGTR